MNTSTRSNKLRTVSELVEAITASYQEAILLLQEIHAKRKSTAVLHGGPGVETAALELEQSLLQGNGNVRGHYERNYRRFGRQFANGDKIAADTLREILVPIQEQLINVLETLTGQITPLDYAALQDVSDASQDRCVLVLMQLQQRIITSGSTENLVPPPLNKTNSLKKNLPVAPARGSSPRPELASIEVSTEVVDDDLPTPRNPRAPDRSNKPSTPPRSSRAPNSSPSRTVSRTTTQRSLGEERLFNELKASVQNQYRPMATTVTKPGFLGFGRRTKIEPVIEPPQNPLVDEYLTTAILDEYRGMERAERASSVSTTASSTISSTVSEADTERGNRNMQQSPNHSESRLRSPPNYHPNLEILTSNHSLSSINPTSLLPSETNNYLGFCKGAWRQQIGDRKRALEERIRPGGMYNAARYWQCKQCKFEGRLVAVDKKTSRFDTRVFKLVDGIQFRWEFLFKSHIYQKDTLSDPTKASFGCIFCCCAGNSADGVGGRGGGGGTTAPLFQGVDAFMLHLIEHRDPLPTGEVLYRMNCLVGRQAGVDEDFDVNFVSREGGLL